jgi:geranylgeranyl transferase type-2 subunit beta
MSYLANLTLRLAAGAARLPKALRGCHAHFLLAAQRSDGGFSGRDGPSDLYYTGFALRSLALLGSLSEPVVRRAADFLRSRLDAKLPIVDFVSLIYSAVLLEAIADTDIFAEAGRDPRQALAAAVAPLRRADGGYAKTAHNPHSSTYHTFLVTLSRQLLGDPPEDPAQMIALVHARRRDDGGFVELAPLRSSGTNPTAAAVALLRLLGTVDGPIRTGAIGFLARMQNAEGGLRANTQIPVADLLSTFTGLVALADLDGLSAIDATAARGYAKGLQQPEGGFRGGTWDTSADMEYTFYGLGVLALLLG